MFEIIELTASKMYGYQIVYRAIDEHAGCGTILAQSHLWCVIKLLFDKLVPESEYAIVNHEAVRKHEAELVQA